MSFVVYHSGFEPGGGGVGPYDPDDPAPQGVDRLIRSMQDAGVEPNANVYAELGGTWWFVMRDPTTRRTCSASCSRTSARTASSGAPTRSGSAHRRTRSRRCERFQISEELQERHGYPALTDELKAKIFGRQLGRPLRHRAHHRAPATSSPEDVEAIRASLPPARTYGPTTYAEAAAMIAAHQGGQLA